MEESQNIADLFVDVRLLIANNLASEQPVSLAALKYIVQNFDEVTSSLEPEKISALVSTLSEKIVAYGLVAENEEFQERDYCPGDFIGLAELVKESITCLKQLLAKFTLMTGEDKRKFFVNVLLLCATHNQHYLWNSEEVSNLSQDFLHELLRCTGDKDISSLLCDDSFCPTVFKSILTVMRPSLTKAKWIKQPSCCHSFSWFLKKVKHPYLVDYLHDVIPPSLMFIDHHIAQSKILGIHCIEHIMDNSPVNLLKMQGLVDVFCDALFPLIYYWEIDILNAVLPCLLKMPLQNRHKALEWSKHDEIFHRLLSISRLEGDQLTRSSYSNLIVLYTEKCINIKHLKQLLEVIEIHLASFDGQKEICIINSLKALKNIIKHCWPRMEKHCEKILKYILFLVYNLETGRTVDEEVKAEILQLCKECLMLLKSSCAQVFQELIQEFECVSDDLPAVKFIKSMN